MRFASYSIYAKADHVLRTTAHWKNEPAPFGNLDHPSAPGRGQHRPVLFPRCSDLPSHGAFDGSGDRAVTSGSRYSVRNLPSGWQATFGPFRIIPARKELLLGDRPVHLGGRAFDVLQALVENAEEFVDKRHLFDRAWPNLVVDETNLRTAIKTVRQALREDGSDRNYIETDPGRGYRLVVGVNIDMGRSPLAALPMPPTKIIGRDSTVVALVSEVRRRRLVNIVGPGGIGKTTAALLTAHQLIEARVFSVVRLVDFSTIHDPLLASSAIRSALNLAEDVEDDWKAIRSALRDENCLLLLDSCELVASAIAAELPCLLAAAPDAAVMATSREPLCARGEAIWRLEPLSIPAPYLALNASQALRYSAIELFVDRATRSSSRFRLTEHNFGQIVGICQRLDGLPLAIELAAAQLDSLDVADLAAELDDHFSLRMPGRNTAPQRHRTLQATLDYSHDALTPQEQKLLRRLSVFCGILTADTVCAVVGDDELRATQLSPLMERLTAKSLLGAVTNCPRGHYKLPETVRAYAKRKLDDAGEVHTFAMLHARYTIDRVRTAAATIDRTSPAWVEFCLDSIGDIRCALKSVLAEPIQPGTALDLTLAAVPVWTDLGLANECVAQIARLRLLPEFAVQTNVPRGGADLGLFEAERAAASKLAVRQGAGLWRGCTKSTVTRCREG